MNRRLFVYGSLLFRDIYEAVTLEPGCFLDARLSAHVRLTLRGELYPAIIPREGCEVAGKLVAEVSPVAMQRLDRFEGDQYDRVSVVVETKEGPCDAEAYVLCPEALQRASEEPWDPAHFERHHLNGFLSRYSSE